MLKALRRRFQQTAPDVRTDPVEHAKWLADTMAKTERAFQQAARKAAEREVAIDRQPRTRRGPTLEEHESRLAAHLQTLRAAIAAQRAAARTPAAPGASVEPSDFTKAEAHIESLESMLRDMEKERDTAASNAAEWERRAMLAVKHGEDDLARGCLETVRTCEREKLSLSNEIDTHRAVLAELRTALAELTGAA
ncbi:MAG: hypothetical protein R3F14_00855 [Polyangiaceae bacterium]